MPIDSGPVIVHESQQYVLSIHGHQMLPITKLEEKMSPKYIVGIIAIVTFASLPHTGLADDKFHIHYRVANLTEDATSRSGTVFLNVYNTSGENVTDMVAWIPEPNTVTYDQRHIGVGNLADGAQVEVLDPFIVPIEITSTEPAEESVNWRLEYTNASGVRQSIDVIGLEAQ